MREKERAKLFCSFWIQRFAVTIANPSSFVSMTVSEYDGEMEDKKTRIQTTFHL